MKINWKIVERFVYIATILVGVIFYIRDAGRDKAIIETTMNVVLEDVKEIKKELNKYDEYWIQQTEINGRIIMYIELDSN